MTHPVEIAIDSYVRSLARYGKCNPEWDNKIVTKDVALPDGKRTVTLTLSVAAISMCERGQGYIADAKAEILDAWAWYEDGEEAPLTGEDRQWLASWTEERANDLASQHLA